MEEGGLLGHGYEEKEGTVHLSPSVAPRAKELWDTCPCGSKTRTAPGPQPFPNCPWAPLTMSSARSRVARMRRRQVNGAKRVNQGRVEISGMPWHRGWVMPGRQYRTTIPNTAPNRVPCPPSRPLNLPCPTGRPPGLQASHLPLQLWGQLPPASHSPRKLLSMPSSQSHPPGSQPCQPQVCSLYPCSSQSPFRPERQANPRPAWVGCGSPFHHWSPPCGSMAVGVRATARSSVSSIGPAHSVLIASMDQSRGGQHNEILRGVRRSVSCPLTERGSCPGRTAAHLAGPPRCWEPALNLLSSSPFGVSSVGRGPEGHEAKAVHPGEGLCPPWAQRSHSCTFIIGQISRASSVNQALD